MSLFADAFGAGGWLAKQARTADGNRTVAYTRGATSRTVPAVLGRVAYRSTPDGAAPVRVEVGDRDYLILAADMAAFGEPRLGDRVTDGGVVYELQTPDTGEPAWRFSDADGTEYRLHVKRV